MRQAKRLYAEHSLEQSAEALFALPEAQRLIEILERKGLVLPASNEPSQARRMGPDEIEAHETAKSEHLRKLGEVMQRLINCARKHGRTVEDPTWQVLQAISKLSIGTLPSQLTGPLTINRRRKELNAQLMASAASEPAAPCLFLQSRLRAAFLCLTAASQLSGCDRHRSCSSPGAGNCPPTTPGR